MNYVLKSLYLNAQMAMFVHVLIMRHVLMDLFVKSHDVLTFVENYHVVQKLFVRKVIAYASLVILGTRMIYLAGVS